MRLKIISIIALITISLSVNAQPQTPTEENEAASKTLFELSLFERAVCCIRFYEGYTAKRIIHMSDMDINYDQERDTPPI